MCYAKLSIYPAMLSLNVKKNNLREAYRDKKEAQANPFYNRLNFKIMLANGFFAHWIEELEVF